jgi:hypothetical protein
MDPTQEHVAHILSLILPFFFLMMVVGVAILIIPLWRICTKAGLAGPLSLIALLPGIGQLIVLYVIAFSDWKVVPLTALPYPLGYPPPYPPPGPGYYPPGPYPSSGPTYPSHPSAPPQPPLYANQPPAQTPLGSTIEPAPPHEPAHHSVESFPAAGYPPPPPPED